MANSKVFHCAPVSPIYFVPPQCCQLINAYARLCPPHSDVSVIELPKEGNFTSEHFHRIGLNVHGLERIELVRTCVYIALGKRNNSALYCVGVRTRFYDSRVTDHSKTTQLQ